MTKEEIFNLIIQHTKEVVPELKNYEFQPEDKFKDFEEPRLRLYVGDLVYPIQGFQGYLPMQGVSVSREFRLDRDTIRSAPGSIELLIQTPSRV